ncbi:hypothetical protein HYV11_02045 [Candidatus Dependentiae bacterium]|nr:hypothetical protein [Candidatus Dependentiae bacterium]
MNLRPLLTLLTLTAIIKINASNHPSVTSTPRTEGHMVDLKNERERTTTALERLVNWRRQPPVPQPPFPQLPFQEYWRTTERTQQPHNVFDTRHEEELRHRRNFARTIPLTHAVVASPHNQRNDTSPIQRSAGISPLNQSGSFATPSPNATTSTTSSPLTYAQVAARRLSNNNHNH